MKRVLMVISLVFCVSLLFGCDKKPQEAEKPKSKEGTFECNLSVPSLGEEYGNRVTLVSTVTGASDKDGYVYTFENKTVETSTDDEMYAKRKASYQNNDNTSPQAPGAKNNSTSKIDFDDQNRIITITNTSTNNISEMTEDRKANIEIENMVQQIKGSGYTCTINYLET